MPASFSPRGAGQSRPDRQILLRLALGYPLLYTLGYVSKSVSGAAAIWPSHSITFAAFMLLPVRWWLAVFLGVGAWEVISRPFFYWLTGEPKTTLGVSACFALANVLICIGPAIAARALRLFHGAQPFALVISPLWMPALFIGSLPGTLLGAATSAYAAGTYMVAADVGLWQLAFVLTVITFGPTVFGALLGFHEVSPRPARSWEGWAVTVMLGLLFIYFSFLPWHDPLVQPMLFAVPLSWLALRFSRRVTNIAVVVVACGVVLLAGHGVGIYQGFTSAAGWRDVVISIDVFLVIACGGALLINLLTVKQRALLDELAREHGALRDYAFALGAAEDTVRRKTAADLHDGIGQVLAGQSMTLAAMRAHVTNPPVRAMLDEAVQASREAQEGLRVMIQDLSPPGLDQASLQEMLTWLADFFQNRYAFSVAWRVSGGNSLAPERSRLIYRCIRELLMNARKHSQCRSAEVEIETGPQGVEITVLDEGVGFDAWALDGVRHGFGLTQLKERVHLAGGSLEIDAVVGEGCRATVRLPADAAAA